MKAIIFTFCVLTIADFTSGQSRDAPSNSPNGIHLGHDLLYFACHSDTGKSLKLTKDQVDDLQTLNKIRTESDQKNESERLAALRVSYKNKAYKVYKAEVKRVVAEIKFSSGEWKIDRLKEVLDKRQFNKLSELAIREIGIQSLLFLHLQNYLQIDEEQAKKIQLKSKELIAKSKASKLKNADEFHKLVAEKYGEDFELSDVQKFGSSFPRIEGKLITGPQKKWTAEYIKVMESMLTPTQLTSYKKLMDAPSLLQR